MRKKAAISILKNQISKLDDSSNHTESWIIETHTYIEKFFGEKSRQGQFFQSVSFKPYPGFSVQLKITETKKHLEDCANTIKNVGLHKPPKNNFFSQLPDWLLVLILTALASVSFLIGKYTSDLQNIELRRENSELKSNQIKDDIR